MISALDIGMTGLQAASTRIDVAARNIVNVHSTGETGDEEGEAYRAQEAVQSAREDGGVTVNVRDGLPATLQIYAPTLSSADEDGMITLPAVNLANEFIDLMLAESSYKAAIAVVETGLEIDAQALKLGMDHKPYDFFV